MTKERYLRIMHNGYKLHKFQLALELVPIDEWYICQASETHVVIKMNASLLKYLVIKYIMKDYLYKKES